MTKGDFLQLMQDVKDEHPLCHDSAEDGRYTWPERFEALAKKVIEAIDKEAKQ